MEHRYEFAAEESGTVEGLLKKRLKLSRHQISRLKYMDNGIMVNGTQVRATAQVQPSDVISIFLYEKNGESTSCGPLPILYEDEWLIIIDKPAGQVVHPCPGHETDSIQTELEAYLHQPLHICGRLDKDTSGCLLFSKVDWLGSRMKVKKTYAAWCEGTPTVDTIRMPLTLSERKMVPDPDGLEAITHILEVNPYGENSFVTLQIDTGRMHQIRAHMASIGHPLIDDPIYGHGGGRALLHCANIAITFEPVLSVTVHSPLPADMADRLEEKP